MDLLLFFFPIITAHYVTVFGDWGSDCVGLKYTSERLAAVKSSDGLSKFTILLGDNFYPSGVVSVDDPQFDLFKRIRDNSERFYVIAGNHDFGKAGSVDAQIAFSEKDPKWKFPSKYYTKRIPVPGTKFTLCMLFLNTEHLLKDPSQKEWLEKELSGCQGEGMIRVVSGHHPVYSAGKYADSTKVRLHREYINPILLKHNVHLYISGHEHQMQALEFDGIHYLIVGSTAKQYGGASTRWGDNLKFQSVEYGFVNFFFDDGEVSYKFIHSKSGDVMYTGHFAVSGEKGVVKGPTLDESEPTVPVDTTSTTKGVYSIPILGLITGIILLVSM